MYCDAFTPFCRVDVAAAFFGQLFQNLSLRYNCLSRIIQINIFTLTLFLVHLSHMLSFRPNHLSRCCLSILGIFISLFAVNPVLFLLHTFPAAKPSVTSLVKMIAQICLDLPGKSEHVLLLTLY